MWLNVASIASIVEAMAFIEVWRHAHRVSHNFFNEFIVFDQALSVG